MIKSAPLSFAGGMFRSFLAFLVFLLTLAAWAYWPVECGGMSWVWAVVTVISFALALWLFCHLLDWANGIVQALVGGVAIDPTRLLTAVGLWLALEAVMVTGTYLAGAVAFGKMYCGGVNIMTVLFTGGIVAVGVIGEIVVFSLLDLPNDALDGWIASRVAREPTPQIEVLRAQKMLHDTEKASAQARLAQLRTKQESQMLPAMEGGDWSMEDELTQF